MYEIEITTIQLMPFELKRKILYAEDILEKDLIIRDYINNINDVKQSNLIKKYESAVKRYLSGKISVPHIYSHPQEGKLLRHVIEVKKLSYD